MKLKLYLSIDGETLFEIDSPLLSEKLNKGCLYQVSYSSLELGLIGADLVSDIVAYVRRLPDKNVFEDEDIKIIIFNEE